MIILLLLVVQILIAYVSCTSWSLLSSNGLPSYPLFDGLAMSENGTYIIVDIYQMGIYISTDFGSTWTITPANPNINAFWNGIGVSYDFSKIFIVD